MPEKRPVGVVLFQLGGPESLATVEPFLYNLFCDPEIIDFPLARVGRKPLARLIAAARARKVQHHYAEIGGGSPIRKFTEQQARALESCLAAAGVNARCVVAMRYWHPFTVEAVAELDAAGCKQVVLLPLYPHYSSTTTGSSLNEWWRVFRGRTTPVETVRQFYDNSLYLDAVVEKIDVTLGRFDHPRRAALVFSAHGVPRSVIAAGDPYQEQVEETVALVMKRGGWPNGHRLCYQSKVGGGRWLEPSLKATLRELASVGCEGVCVAPISFVSDHVETLGEINHGARQFAHRLGISHFEMTPGLNDSPKFISALAEMVMNCIRAQEGAALSKGLSGSLSASAPGEGKLAAD
jgi:ferrochelatase